MSHNDVFILALNAMRNLLIQELNRLIGHQELRAAFIAGARVQNRTILLESEVKSLLETYGARITREYRHIERG